MKFVLTAVVALCLPPAGGAEVGDRAGWFREAKWGVFMHYLAESAELPVSEWNRRIDGFNVEGLAHQLQAGRRALLLHHAGPELRALPVPERSVRRLCRDSTE